jgi:endoglucanase
MGQTSPADTLTLRLSEDAYKGDAQFAVTVDGASVGSVQTVTASHAAGAQQTVTFEGSWGAGPHKVSVKYLNDAYGGSSATDRNLYLTSAEYDGNPYADIGKGMYSAGEAAQFTVQAPGQGGSTTPTAASAAASVSAPASASPAAPVPTSSSSPHMSLVGVNLAGPAFAPQNVPGVLGTDYVYPTHNEIDHFASKGMNVFRLSFLMERLEHSQGGAFDAAELARIDDVVNYASSKGIKVILDPHNFGAAWGNDIGSAGTPASSLTTFNAKLAEHFANTPSVMFGIMNEAHNQSATQWEPIVQDSVNAIRAAGATSQEILVPGTYWQNAKDWTNSDNAAVMGKVTDPNHNMAYELHVYFDAGSGGVQPDTVSPTIGVERITDATKWAEATGNRLFLGEFGVSGDSAGLAALSNTLNYMDQHTDAWEGTTYWAAGPAWGDMFMSIEPSGGPGNYTDKPQMDILTQHLATP